MIDVKTLFGTLFGTLLGTLREIFDEAAYARFLSRTKMASSARAYAAFREEFEEAKERRPKCC
jgi:hypothetical protein